MRGILSFLEAGVARVLRVEPREAVGAAIESGRELVGAQIQFLSSLIVTCVFCFCRLQADNPEWFSVAACLSASWMLLGIPLSTPWGGGAREFSAFFTRWFYGVLLRALLAYAVFWVFGNSRVFIAVLGLIQVMLLSRSGGLLGKLDGLLVTVCGLTLFCCSVLWSSGYVSPLLDELLHRGEVYEDVLMNISISEMIRSYDTPSTGLHGVPYFGYHWGVHAVIGLATNCLAIPVSLGYSLLFPVVIIPLLLRFLISSAAVCARSFCPEALMPSGFGMVAVLLVVWPVAILSYSGGLPPGIQYVIPYISESLLASVVMSLVVIGLFFELLQARGWSAAVSGSAVLVAVAVVIVCKVTTGFAVVAWLCLTSTWVSIARKSWTMAGFLCLLSVASAALVKTVFAGEGILMARGAYATGMFMVRFAFVRNLFCYTLPALIVALTFPHGGLGDVFRFRCKTKTWQVSAVVAALLTYIVSPLPALLFSFSDDEKYFLWAPVFFSTSWMLASCSVLFNRFSVRNRITVGMALSVTLVAAVSNEGLDLISDVRRVSGRQVDTDSPRSRLLTLLADTARGVPLSEKKQIGLFIQRNVRAAALRENSLPDLFLPCAISGLAQVYGGPVEGSAQSAMATFSLNCYRARPPGDPDYSQLKLECQRLGFRKLLVVSEASAQFRIESLEF